MNLKIKGFPLMEQPKSEEIDLRNSTGSNQNLSLVLLVEATA